MFLEACPPEVFECIAIFLPLRDTANLRLTSRILATGATQEHFKANFYAKRVEISLPGLRRFVAATKSAGLQTSLLRQLTIVAPVYNTLELEARLEHKAKSTPMWADDGNFDGIGSQDINVADLQHTELELRALRWRRDEHMEFVRRRDDVALLSQAFANLVNHGVTLQSICAEVMVYRTDASTPVLPPYGGGWKHIWASAANGSRVILSSLANTGLCVGSIDLFNTCQMQRCSLPCDQLIDIDIGLELLKVCLGQLQKLSMSISDKIFDQSSQESMDLEDYCATIEFESFGTFRPTEDIVREARNGNTFAGLRFMLRECRQLKELNISHFELDYSTPEVTRLQSQGIFQAIHTSPMSSLRRCTLQGFEVSDSQLIQTLRSFPALQTLSLRCITLVGGSNWSRVLDYCTSEAEGITEMYLDSLFEPRILLFKPPHAIVTAAEQSQECYEGSRAHYRRQSDLSSPTSSPSRGPDIKYSLYPGRRIRSPAVRSWEQNLKNRYGPPGYGAEACVRDVLLPEGIWQLRP